jgi:hypothetical protein
LPSSRPKSGDDACHLGDEPLVVAPEGTTIRGSASNGGHSREISKALPRGVSPRMTTRTREYLWYETTRATIPLCTLTAALTPGMPIDTNSSVDARRLRTHHCSSRITSPKGCGAWLQTRRQTGYLPGGGR